MENEIQYKRLRHLRGVFDRKPICLEKVIVRLTSQFSIINYNQWESNLSQGNTRPN